jgi:hypothetical protein
MAELYELVTVADLKAGDQIRHCADELLKTVKIILESSRDKSRALTFDDSWTVGASLDAPVFRLVKP